MQDNLDRIRQQASSVWCMKFADRIANMQKPPAHWSMDKKVVYQFEAESILNALGSANPTLSQWLAGSIASYSEYLR